MKKIIYAPSLFQYRDRGNLATSCHCERSETKRGNLVNKARCSDYGTASAQQFHDKQEIASSLRSSQ
jgi:hypothetical protein